MKISWEWHEINYHEGTTKLLSVEEEEFIDAEQAIHYISGLLSDIGGVITVKNLNVIR